MSAQRAGKVSEGQRGQWNKTQIEKQVFSREGKEAKAEA